MIAAAAAVVAGAWARCLRACLAAWLASCASLVRFVHTSCAAALAAARWSAGAAWVGASAVAVAAPVAAALAVAWAANEWLGVARSRAAAADESPVPTMSTRSVAAARCALIALMMLC